MQELSFTPKVLLAATPIPAHIHITFHLALRKSYLKVPISCHPSKSTHQTLAISAPIPSHCQTLSQSMMARVSQSDPSAVLNSPTQSKLSQVIMRYCTHGSLACSPTITGQTRLSALMACQPTHTSSIQPLSKRSSTVTCCLSRE